MTKVSHMDFRIFKPSDARRLSELLEDPSTHSDIVEDLRQFVAGLDVGQMAEVDQAVVLSHELAATGFWDMIRSDDLVSGLQDFAPRQLRALLTAAPRWLNERLVVLEYP